MTTYYPCSTCHHWVQVAPSTPRAGFLCTTCQPKPTPLQLALNAVLAAIRPYHARLKVAAVWVALWAVVVVSWVGVMVLR